MASAPRPASDANFDARATFSPRDLAERAGLSAPGGLEWLSSTRLFQALHAEHWPDHREWTAPQVWQA